MNPVALYETVDGDLFQVHSDGGYAELTHTPADGSVLLIEEGETPDVLVEFAELVLADMAPGLLCDCDDPETCDNACSTAK
jgi:hypothetical protein